MAGDGFGLLEVKGRITVQPDSVALENVDLQFDQIKGKANTRVNLARTRPSIEGALELDRLDLNPYLPKGGSGGEPASRPAPAPPSGVPGPKWSTEEIDFSPLRAADANLSFQAKEIIYDKIKVGASAVSLKLDNGRLNLNLTRLDLYKGSGEMKLALDSQSSPPALTQQLKLSGIEAQPLLKDAADLGFLSGKANAAFSVTARGKSQMQMVQSLNGNLSVQFLDGAIEGVNLGAMFRNVKAAFLDPKAGEARKTDFSELSSTFKIQNGVMRTDDLQLKSPLLRLDGKGDISLPPKTMNMRLEPKVALTSKGQGGEKEVGGVKVPVVVKGPWENLSYMPDLEGMIKDLPKEKAKGLLEEAIKDKGKKGDLPGALKGLFR
jgi:AsmA protein